MSIMNSILLVLCLVITRIYGLDELSPNTTVLSASENITDLIIEQTTTEIPSELIVTTYQPFLIPIPTTNPKFNNENIDNNVNDDKSEKFPPNIYAETIFLPVAPQNYRPDLTHESLSRSNKFNLLDFTSYIHPPVLPDLSGNSPDFPKAERLVVPNPNVDPSLLKKSNKGGKSKKAYKGNADHSNYPKPYAVHDDNYYPNNFYEYFKNDFYRNHRDRYDIDPQHYANPPQKLIRAPYYHPGGGTCPGGGSHNLALQAPPLYYNFATQPIKFDGHPNGPSDSEEEEEEEEEEEGDEEGEEGEEGQEVEHQHATDDKTEKKDPPNEKTNEKQKKQEDEEEQSDYSDYNDEEEVEGDETEEERKQNLKFRDTEEEERFHLDREKFRDDREKFRNDHEKFRSHDSNEEDDDDEENDEEDGEEDEAHDKRKNGGRKKSRKSKKRGDDEEEDYEDEEQDSGEKSNKKPINKDVEIIESTTAISPPATQRGATFQIAPRSPQNSISNTYFPASATTVSPNGDYTTAAGFRRRTNLVQSKLKRLNLLPESTTPLIKIPRLTPTSAPRYQARRSNLRYTQLTTEQPFIINTDGDNNPKAQYENIAEDAQEGKSELKMYTVAPRRYRGPPTQIQNGASNEQYTTTPIPRHSENRALYSQNLYFAPREQIVQIPTPHQYNQPRLVYNHPTQIQRPQEFTLTPETPNLNPNLIQYPAQSRQIQSQSRIKKQNYETQPVNYETYTLYKQKRDVRPDSTTDIKYSSSYRILNDNTPNTNESDVAASYLTPVNITSGERRIVPERENAETTAIPDVKKTEDDEKEKEEKEEAAKETETEPSRQDEGRKILNQVKYFQYANVFGNGSYNAGVGKGNPDHFILQLERADKDKGVFQKRVRWGDKKGGYGEHYWDLNHHKPKIEDGASSSNVNNDKISNNNNNSSKLESAADDHNSDDHDGVKQDGK